VVDEVRVEAGVKGGETGLAVTEMPLVLVSIEEGVLRGDVPKVAEKIGVSVEAEDGVFAGVREGLDGVRWVLGLSFDIKDGEGSDEADECVDKLTEVVSDGEELRVAE